MERKLTAILCADVYGYSRLMGENEEGTLRTLSSYRKLIDSLIEQHRGRFVNSAGDSVLAEFASVVDAMQCAVVIQGTLKAENATRQPEQWMEFRIGVNLGDVMEEGEQIYGDGVNIAARLESLAEPGGICISGSVHEQLGNKLALIYEDLGEQQVKNIAKPVRVYRVLTELGGASTAPSPKTESIIPRKYWRGIFLITGLAIIVATVVVVQHLSLRAPTPSASIPLAQPPALPLPDKPSIAVLPFTNMSGDRDQEYFSDGITDDLTAALSSLPDLFVIARTSAFTYKGKAVKVQDISRRLGVKYLLEGSVRKADEQVRITAQLVDATTGDHLWAEHYDRPLRNIFSLQNEIVRKIVTTLTLQLTLAEQGIPISKRTDNLAAYDYYLQGMQYFNYYTKDGDEKARQMFEKAVALDSGYSDAYARLAALSYNDYVQQWSGDAHLLDRVLQMAQQAITLDSSDAFAYAMLSEAYLYKRDYEQGLATAQRAVTISRNSPWGYYMLGAALRYFGRPAESIEALETAMRLDPLRRQIYLIVEGEAYAEMGRYELAISVLKATLPRYYNVIGVHLYLAVCYMELGRLDEARAEAAEVMRINPAFSVEKAKQISPLKEPVRDRLYGDMAKAGLR